MTNQLKIGEEEKGRQKEMQRRKESLKDRTTKSTSK